MNQYRREGFVNFIMTCINIICVCFFMRLVIIKRGYGIRRILWVRKVL